ncbi:MAG TPA: twin-arginine translocase TatA/TatE family subunit [Candidatus Polarisedimenticolia bacterium]|nr:twin-arginine translocase TatA/TatE family subunit [Candidatus Polarisedimenticolia bacterium]
MFGSIGGFELLVLVGLGLLVFGPRRLPEIGRTIGRTLQELRKAAMEVKTSIEKEIELDSVKEVTQSIARTFREEIPTDLLSPPEEVSPSAGTDHDQGAAKKSAGGTGSGTGSD